MEVKTMRVTVTLKYSFYRKFLKDQEWDNVSLDKGATVQDLVDQLGIPDYYLNKITVNGEYRDFSATLRDGDTVAIWPPLIGGG